MKKILAIIAIFSVLVSCGKLEDLNKNTKDPASVSGESLFTNAQKNLFDQIVNTNVNTNIFRLIVQYWTETTYTDESNYDLNTRTIPDNHWDIMYRDVLKNLNESSKVITNTEYLSTENPAIKKNKLAIVEIMTVYSYSVLVETFGNVPYTQALNLDNKLPKYDDGLTIYKDLLTRLNAAIANIDQTAESFGRADNMYQGDAGKWYRFANSLKLRMGMLLSDVDAATAKATVEAAAPKAFTSNSDNATLVYGISAPNTNPIYADLVASGRHDFVPTSTIVDAMNTLNDPRLPMYFEKFENAYSGGGPGASNDYYGFSHVSNKIQVASFEGMIFDYSEVEFLRAEAKARTFSVDGSIESHYDNAVTASIIYWGGTPTDATAYLSQEAVAYSSASGDWKTKIGTQQWIAYYNRGFEAWTEWRRLDIPELTPAIDALSVIPLRYTYPIAEQTLNGANYTSASAAIGSDDVATKLFWDKH
jgi:hypothetical protein